MNMIARGIIDPIKIIIAKINEVLSIVPEGGSRRNDKDEGKNTTKTIIDHAQYHPDSFFRDVL